MLVLAMLSQIAQDKQNVIFAMEEPETAVPPYAQKRIVHEVRKLASQTIFTSHSPYVLEEFAIDETVVLSRDPQGNLCQSAIVLPGSVKLSAIVESFARGSVKVSSHAAFLLLKVRQRQRPSRLSAGVSRN